MSETIGQLSMWWEPVAQGLHWKHTACTGLVWLGEVIMGLVVMVERLCVALSAVADKEQDSGTKLKPR